MRHILLAAAALAVALPSAAQVVRQTKSDWEDKFRQLEDEAWPTPSDARLASGAPGPAYWQQQVDYKITARLIEDARRLEGSQTFTYTNNSPHTLSYLWLQLDQNRFRGDSIDSMTRTTSPGSTSYNELRRIQLNDTFEGGYTLANIRDARGRTLASTTVDTNLRIDLAEPLKPGASVSVSMDFAFNIVDSAAMGARGGYECFTKPDQDGNCIFLVSQWFPRLHAYTDYEGWHNKAFLGAGEFTLEFGNYDVSLTVPEDHIISATGSLTNAKAVLTPTQLSRYEQARTASAPVFIVTPQEAAANEADRSTATRTWNFKASRVRDFAWASSRKFIWDGMNVRQDGVDGPDVLAMSFYPKEAEPLWSAYSTKSVAHTIRVYSKYSIPYPYPTAQSVNGPVGGMEYPMITYNGPRPYKDKDGNLTYSERTKYGLIGVIIHEIGHIYFPMVINSDERQWTWMDEGLNTFLQFVAEKEWEDEYPARRGEPKDIVDYMLSTNQVPIMTQSDSLLQFGNNAYSKPATALNILRETILGRELFDRAFREYSQRWAFKRPTPSDFFRTMEEASGVDLDWFWHGWFYTTDHVDISLDRVRRLDLASFDAKAEAEIKRKEANDIAAESLTVERNANIPKAVEQDPTLLDFYNDFDRFSVGEKDVEAATKRFEDLEPWEKDALAAGGFYYQLTFTNKGGLVMPVILELTFASGKKEIVRIPAEIWRRDPKTVSTMLRRSEEIVSVELDPRLETADADRSNNVFPPRIEPTRVEAFKAKREESLMERLDYVVPPDSLEYKPKPKAEPKADADAKPPTP
jgi:hypothetical protein